VLTRAPGSICGPLPGCPKSPIEAGVAVVTCGLLAIRVALSLPTMAFGDLGTSPRLGVGRDTHIASGHHAG
jgi:hypothetical protein